ncbi:MAG: response regulator [Acidobacteriia bacterium]|jgi:pilus assembly protein CpaE|nr:response regulator [Terriglobia bacterium]
MSVPFVLMVASSDEHFREMVRDNLLNIPNSKVGSEYQEVSSNLYVRVLQDIERHPNSAVVVDLSGDTETGLKSLERLKQAVPDLYVIVSNYHADGETVIQAMRMGANDFLQQPIKRSDFRDAMARFERAPRRVVSTESKLGKVYTFLGAKGGVGTTSLAVNFAAVLAQRKQSVVAVDLDWTANDVAMQVGANAQYTLSEVAENMHRMDQALFESLVTRDPLGFYLVGPNDSLENRGYFSESIFREFSTFLVEKYDSTVVDAGKNLNDEVVAGACQVSTTIFVVVNQEFAAIRNAQRYIGSLVRGGATQDQIRVVVNKYTKKPSTQLASLEQIKQTLGQPVFYGIPESGAFLAAINKARPLVADRQFAPELDKALRAFVSKATTSPAAAAAA